MSRNSASPRPNLFLIGAMKSGTTYLTKLLASHPSIFMCRPEEPSYFVDQRELRKLWPRMWDRGYWTSEERYLRLFQNAGGATVIGESSTNYSKRPLVSNIAEKIKAFNPDARFIYTMRDPVERTLSHYWHMVRYHAEHRSPLRAITEDRQYCDVSYYAMQLAPYFACFGRERVKTLTFEALTSNPKRSMNELFRWLAVDSVEELPEMHIAENVTPDVVATSRLYGRAQWFVGLPAVHAVARHMPSGLRRIARALATRPVNRDNIDIRDVLEYLQPLQRRQTKELEMLLEREFPEWLTLHRDLPGTSR